MIKIKITTELKAARKDRNQVLADFYRTIIGEFDRVSKTPTEDEQVRIIRTLHKTAVTLGNTDEVILLHTMLPVLMSEEEIINTLDNISSTLEGKPNIGYFMKAWTQSGLKGKADMGLVGELIKSRYL